MNLWIRTRLKKFYKTHPTEAMLAPQCGLAHIAAKAIAHKCSFLQSFISQGVLALLFKEQHWVQVGKLLKKNVEATPAIFSTCLVNTLLLPISNLLCAINKAEISPRKECCHHQYWSSELPLWIYRLRTSKPYPSKINTDLCSWSALWIPRIHYFTPTCILRYLMS